jgi:hypothetical protein
MEYKNDKSVDLSIMILKPKNHPEIAILGHGALHHAHP